MKYNSKISIPEKATPKEVSEYPGQK